MSGAAEHRDGPRQFTTTQWSLVLAAGDSRDPHFHDALADLCQRYWYPVYAYVRRRVRDVDAAQDLAQGFFCHLLEKKTLKSADRDRGRFRSFLLGALKLYLADERDRARAKKRGGETIVVPLDLEAAERRYASEAEGQEDPDRLFARRWALEVLARAHARLTEALERAANPERSRCLTRFLTGGETGPYRDVAAELGISESAVKVAVHRLRRRFGVLLREEVASTVNDPARIDDELRFLFTAVGAS